jgi:hypothetical protein
MSSHVPRGTGRAGERGSSDAPHLGTVQGLLRGLLPVGHLTVRVRVREADRVLHGSRPAPEASSGVIATPYPRRERMSPVPRRSRRISPPRSTRRAIGPPLRRVGARTAQAPRTATTTQGPAGRTRPAGKAPAATPPPPPPPPPPIPGRRARGPEAAPTARSWRSWLELPQPQPTRAARGRERRGPARGTTRAHTRTRTPSVAAAAQRGAAPAMAERAAAASAAGGGDGQHLRWADAATFDLRVLRGARARGLFRLYALALPLAPLPRAPPQYPTVQRRSPRLPPPFYRTKEERAKKSQLQRSRRGSHAVCAHHPTALDSKTLCTTAKHRGRFCTVRAGG